MTMALEEVTSKNVLLLPIGKSNDGAHYINEKLYKKNYIQSVKLLGSYLHYTAEELQQAAWTTWLIETTRPLGLGRVNVNLELQRRV